MTTTSFSRHGAFVFAACLISSTISCSGDPISPPGTQNVKGIRIDELTPNRFEARAGAFVEPAPSIRLRAVLSGRPVAGVTVEFRAGPGAGFVQNPVTRTDASGIATAGAWQVGTLPRSAVLTAIVGDQKSSFTVDIKPDVPQRVNILAQTVVGFSGELIEGPRLIVFDRYGNPTPGIPVTFAIVSGSGALENSSAITNRDGRFAVGGWRLGSQAGENAIAVTVNGLEPVRYTTQGLDPSVLTRYKLEGVRQYDNEIISPDKAGLAQGTLRITAFDRCLCRTEAGYFIMNIEYTEPTPEPTSIAGEYAIQPPQLVLYGGVIQRVAVENGEIEINILRDTYDWRWEETWIFRPEA